MFIKDCSCCKIKLRHTQVEWLTKLMITKKSYLKLFNCVFCKSTNAIRVDKRGLE